ncbi:MAG: VirB3 family type IV secretion system protein [Neisseriaceae bacterium]|nr:VirB3 family type IV secretion system protein [Neisseriaceae bacterium]
MVDRIDEITFNGLDRPAMFFGAPVKPLGFLFLALCLISATVSAFLGGKAFFLVGLIIPIHTILKFVCERDENALRVLRYSIKYYCLYRFNFNRSIRFMFLSKNPIFDKLTFLPIVTFKKKDNIMKFKSDFFSKISQRQFCSADFLPKIIQHVTEDIIYYKDGRFGFGFKLTGFNFEGVDEDYLYHKYKIFNQALMTLSKNFGKNCQISAITKHRKINFDPQYEFKNIFAKRFTQKYLKNINQQDCFVNDFYLFVVIKENQYQQGLKKIKDQINLFMTALADFEPEVLSTYRNENGVIFSEIYELLGSLINLSDEQIPLSSCHAYESLPKASIHFGNNLIEIRNNQQTKWAKLFDLREYGLSKLKVLTPVLDLPFEYNLIHHFHLIDRGNILSKINKQLNEFESVGDQAIFQQAELLEMQGHVSSNTVSAGILASSLIIIAPTPQEASYNASKAIAEFLRSGGFIYEKAGWSAPATFFAQIPGSKEIPRTLTKAITNFSHIAYPYNHSTGKKNNNPLGDGSAIMPLITTSKTLYWFNFHYTEAKEKNNKKPVLGHTLILGKSETGKSTLLNTLLTFSLRFEPYIFALDLDLGMEIFIRAIGGQYFQLKIGQDTGINPFHLKPTDENIDFINSLIEMCAGNNLTSEEEKDIHGAVKTVMQLALEQRDFNHLLQNIDSRNLKNNLSKWVRGGRFGWVFDNPKNIHQPEDFEIVGFDVTEIFKFGEDYPPTEPLLAYIFHLRHLFMQKVAKTKRPIATVIEEFWFASQFPKIAEEIKKVLKSERKRHNFAILVSQSPADAIRSTIFEPIIEQTATKIFLPNPSAEYENAYQRCGITKTEFERVVNLGEKSRQFLIKQGHQSAVAQLNLSGFDDEMAVLSGTSSNVEILHEVLKEVPNHQPETWLDIFIRSVK